MDYNSDTDRLREIFSVRFGLLSFSMQRGLQEITDSRISDDGHGTPRALLRTRILVLSYRRCKRISEVIHFAPDGGKRYSAVANIR